MGQSRTRQLAQFPGRLAWVLALLLIGCSSGQGDARETLLGPGNFQDVSGVLDEARGPEGTASLFFVQGRFLVRISVSGSDRRQLLPAYAEKARLKASRR